jgi:hypothetical protein
MPPIPGPEWFRQQDRGVSFASNRLPSAGEIGQEADSKGPDCTRRPPVDHRDYVVAAPFWRGRRDRLCRFGHCDDSSCSTPLGGICVAVNQVGGGTNGWGVTQSDGTYQVGGGFPTGTYTVKFYAGANCPSNPGNYDFQYYGNQPTVTTTQPVSVTNGVTTTGIDAAMVTGGSIAGTVRAAASGTGLQTICVNSIGSGVPGNSYSTTDINGNFTIDALNTGTYAILFGSYSGFTCGSASYQYQWYNQKLGQGTATPVSVMVGQTTSGIDASLTANPITSTTAISDSPALVGQGRNVTYSATVT